MTATDPATPSPHPRAADRESGEALRLTPGQWRRILEDPSFLQRPDNRYQRPRRLNGLPVEIVREG
jgi:hypothetical protein